MSKKAYRLMKVLHLRKSKEFCCHSDITNISPTKCSEKPYGWLSPTGIFTPGDFAEHEEIALDIIKKKGWREEYFTSQDVHRVTRARDFLAAKGWCLVHDPSGQNGYLVSHEKPLTRKQNDFLFGYFSDLGDHLRAEKYLTD